MRILVLSDIHSNSVALKAVLQDAGNFDQVWCLGDIVGYGPEPNECIDQLRALNPICLAGNHDLAVVGKLGLWDFNPDAQSAVFLNRHLLTLDNRAWLETLTPTLELPDQDVTLVHGSPADPIWEYVFTPPVARGCFEKFSTRFCFNGHTHVPLYFRKPEYEQGIMSDMLRANAPISLAVDRWMINPGGVGQPRDDDPRAAYALIDWDAKTITERRIQYDVALMQKKMKQAQLPTRLIRRLRFGQ